MTPPPSYAFPIDGWAEVIHNHVYISANDEGRPVVILSRNDIVAFRDWLNWANIYLFFEGQKNADRPDSDKEL